MQRVVIGTLAVLLTLGACAQALAQSQRSGGAQASSCYMYPQFVAPRFIQPDFERRAREKNDRVKPELYRAEFVRPQFIAPEIVRPQFQPRTYLGCSGNRFQPVENGYKLAMVEYGQAQTNRAPQDAQAQLAAVSQPASSYHYKPPARDADCCAGDLELKPAPATARDQPKVN